MLQKPKPYLSRLSPSFLRYLVIGSIVYVFEVLLILILQKAGASAVVAVGLSFWAGLLLSFVLQKFITFKEPTITRNIVAKQFMLLSLLVVFNFLFTIAFTSLLHNLLSAVICRTIAIVITVSWNYLIYKRYIFIKIR